MRPKVTDAQFDYVAGPMRPGDEHPVNRGWYFTGRKNRRGEWLWYKPPGPISRWIKRIALVIYILLMAMGVTAGLLLG